MNELEMTRALFDPPAPTVHTSARARARMLDGTGRAARRPVRWLPIGLGVMATATAAAVGIATFGSGSPAALAAPGKARPADGSARTILLAAAEKAERQPMGKYWFSNEVSGLSYVIRAKTGTYTIIGAHDETMRWTSAKAGDGTSFYGRDLPLRLATSQDKAGWRRAGSPKSLRVWSGDKWLTFTTAVGTWGEDDPNPKGGGKVFTQRGDNGLTLTLAQVQNLPTDPKKLGDFFFKPQRWPVINRKTRRVTMVMRSRAEVPASSKINQVATVFEDLPPSPKAKAGLMRALADEPGVHTVGTATDPLGRQGVALAADVVDTLPQQIKPSVYGYGSRVELISDRATGALLAEQTVLTKPGGGYSDQKPGFVINYAVIRNSGWTDTTPKPPTKLPF